MKNIQFVTCFAIFIVTAGLAWKLEAKDGSIVNPTDLIYNRETKVYQHQEKAQFANHSLEQKLLAIQFITRHQDQLAFNELP